METWLKSSSHRNGNTDVKYSDGDNDDLPSFSLYVFTKSYYLANWRGNSSLQQGVHIDRTY